MPKCSKCHPAHAEYAPERIDFCGKCGAYLCGDHMRTGCCGEQPAVSGLAKRAAAMQELAAEARLSPSPKTDAWYRQEAMRKLGTIQPSGAGRYLSIDPGAEVQNVSVGAWVQVWLFVEDRPPIKEEKPS